MRPEFDVVVAGAGPGGCSAAASVKRLDPSLRVLVIDKSRFPRSKPCGGGLTGHCAQAMAALGFDLEVDAISADCARVQFGGFTRDVRLDRPVRVIRRDQFDASLVVQVRRSGIEVEEGESLTGFDVSSDGVRITTTRRTVSARVLVGADGAASVVRKRVLPARPAVPHRLFTAEVPMPAGWHMPNHMLYDFSLLPRGLRGYLWVFPAPEGKLNVGLMHYPAKNRLGGAQLVGLLRSALGERGIELPEAGVRGWPAWGYDPASRLSAPRVLLVGDAAGIDGLTGEGIAVAMEQAAVAGEQIGAALATGDFSFRGYRAAVRRATVGRELALDRWLAWMLYGGSARWRTWLPLVLFDDRVLEMYAARVAGTEVLADSKASLYWSMARHAARFGRRRRQLVQAGRAAGLALPGCSSTGGAVG